MTIAQFLPLIFLLAGVLAGVVAEVLLRLLLRPFLRHATATTREQVIHTLRYRPLLWLSLLGLYGMLENLGFSEPRAVRLQDLAARGVLLLLIIAVSVQVANLVGIGLRRYSDQHETTFSGSSILSTLPRVLVLALGLLVALQSVGVQVTAVLTALGVGGVAVALALQDTLSNLFAGIYILLSRKIRPNDFIRLESGHEGYVQDINLRHTTVRELSNNLVVIPNAKMAGSVNRNYNLPESELSVTIEAGVSYSNNLHEVERITVEVAKETMHEVPGSIETFEPFVRFHTFDELGIRFSVILRASQFVDQYLIKHEFIKRLHQRYEQEGVEMLALDRSMLLRERQLAANS